MKSDKLFVVLILVAVVKGNWFNEMEELICYFYYR